MNKRIKRLWIKALRSGKYRQGRGQLCSEIGNERLHCCLGVLQEVAIKEGVIGSYAHSQALLDERVCEWAGLGDTNPKLGPRVDSPHATTLNDSRKDFNYIADRIEKYL